MRLKDLYLLLNSKEMHDVLQVDGIKDSTVASLRLSLEASIKIMQKEDSESLQFFFFIGMLPGGIEEEELEQIWGPNSKKHIEQLVRFSLIQKKEGDSRLILPPFMSNYAEAKIPQDDKLIFQNDICHYYSKICENILLKNGKSVKKSSQHTPVELNHDLVASLIKHETNIWACIYRMVEAPKPELESKMDEETIRNDVNQRLRRISTAINPHQSQGEDMGLMRRSTIIEIDSLQQTSPAKKKTLASAKKIP